MLTVKCQPVYYEVYNSFLTEKIPGCFFVFGFVDRDSLCSALMLLVGQQEGYPACEKNERWVAGMVICLGQGADLHMAQLMPLPLTVSCSSKSRLVLPFW